MNQILSIVDTAYRATLEEQDDTSLWFIAACTGAGAKITVLLTGAGVNYALTTQNPKPKMIGNSGFAHPPKHQDDLKRMLDKGIPIFMIREDIEERGIPMNNLMKGLELISRGQLAQFVTTYDQVWYW